MFCSANCSIKIILGRSGLTTMISTAGGNISATYFNNTFTQFNMSNFGNESSYIWQGPGTDTNCPRSIRAVQDFQVKCVDHKVKFDINADARYNFTLSSPSYTKTGSGTSNTSMDHYEYSPPTGNFSCGNTALTQDKSFTWSPMPRTLDL